MGFFNSGALLKFLILQAAYQFHLVLIDYLYIKSYRELFDMC